MTYGIVADRRDAVADMTAQEFRDLALGANRDASACAYGKVAIIGPGGISTFQTNVKGDVSPVFCGNSTAAAIGRLGVAGDMVTKVHGVALEPYEVAAHADGDRVTQTWMVPPAPVEERSWRGRTVLLIRALNDYAILLGPLPSGISPEAARRELLGPDHASKLAVIDAAAEIPVVAFYNSNGKHGGAPQTGVATIALAARSVPWLDRLFADGSLTYSMQDGARTCPLPAMSAAGDRLAVVMPCVAVSLIPLALERVA